MFSLMVLLTTDSLVANLLANMFAGSVHLVMTHRNHPAIRPRPRGTLASGLWAGTSSWLSPEQRWSPGPRFLYLVSLWVVDGSARGLAALIEHARNADARVVLESRP